MQEFEFHHAAVAGTFDRLHNGHKALLTKAFEAANKISVGITTEAMTRGKQLATIVESFAVRKAALEHYLQEHQWQNRAQFFPLHDVYGSALTDTTLDALVVSTQTLAGGKEVNQKRQENGLEPLALIVADYVVSDDQSYLSSTRIRAGEIDRKGFVYKQFLQAITPYTISFNQRNRLQKPIGELVFGSEADLGIAVEKLKPQLGIGTLLFTVGDIITAAVVKADLPVTLALIDEKNKREAFPLSIEKIDFVGKISNQAGSVSLEALEALVAEEHHWLDGTTGRYLLIDGEEDLLVLPLVLLTPLHSLVCYGQSEEGIVVVRVTEEKKHEIVTLLTEKR